MTVDTKGPLYMLQVALDTAALLRLERSLKVPPRLEDEGYLVHAALRTALGEGAPQPFALGRVEGRRMTVLGYVGADEDTLRGVLGRKGGSEGAPIVDPGSLRVKEMPNRFAEGLQLAFEVRVCPVVRRSSGDARAKAGAEVDAFLAECWRVGDGVVVDREAVYRGWLDGQLGRGGARVLDAKMEHFVRRRLLRRTQGTERRARGVERPDVLFKGRLEVTDGSAFGQLVRRGVGRHRAFGFGMLLLASGGRSPC
ncbi:MAG: type I-E CRISPR-associated protein Cas6/Cse3/CasE [Dehalococcoidia bacterium]|nr:type I-E CRISPR-associated protein Cas6/Cse3/CasE [Dehalococcoidia bacterium]